MKDFSKGMVFVTYTLILLLVFMVISLKRDVRDLHKDVQKIPVDPPKIQMYIPPARKKQSNTPQFQKAEFISAGELVAWWEHWDACKGEHCID